jgi:hypothetical protein
MVAMRHDGQSVHLIDVFKLLGVLFRVQSFFSLAGGIMTVDRASMGSQKFERMCLMKANPTFVPERFVFDWVKLGEAGIYSN